MSKQMAGAMRRVSEFFLLNDLKERAATVAPDERERLASVYARAKQRSDAAEALWVAGFPAEAMRLAAEARELVRGDAPAPEQAALPILDKDVTPEHTERFRSMQSETSAALDAQFGKWMDAQAIRGLQMNRIAVSGAVVLAVLIAAVLALRTPRLLKAEASAHWGNDPRYDASKAVDGSDRTDWLLPDKTLGWLDLQVVPPRKLKRMNVTNARNVPYNDRATNEFHVEVFDGGQVVKQFDGSFEGFNAEPVTKSFDLGVRADRIRITVKSHHLTGAGFGEVSVD